MSSYEDYTAVSAAYDRTRVPIGVEIILGCLQQAACPLARLTLLDAGCGTGAYSRALIERVGMIEAVDLNPGMLGVARAKLAAFAPERVRFHQAPIDALPLDARSVDAVMVNQVLHHLPGAQAPGRPHVAKVLGEFARVLRPGGILLINMCSYEQLRSAWWYASLIPEAVESVLRLHVPIDELAALLEAGGFTCRGRFVPVDATIQGEHYFNPRGPLDDAWRRGDSVWGTVSEAELARAQARIRALDEAGTLEDFVAEQDARRRSIGQVTFVCAVN